ncbi:hypothetical protein CEE34_05595 [Candidatus Aerophobetes bacterium Ae_b3a]|nr:MAG: hypothetical protein CEE34_05595 [Candidatus Aerophobetes bacterium Ae_b3a]
MPHILVVEGDKRTPVEGRKFVVETDLQNCLEKFPELIPLKEIDPESPPLLAIGREVSLPQGAVIDLMYVDAAGILTIVETKLARSYQAHRAVIGQIVEYASYILKWTAEDIERIANEYLSSNRLRSQYQGKKLREIIPKLARESVPEQGERFPAEDFKSNLERNLREGRIRLIIGIDEVVEPLRETVIFLNSFSTFDIFLLQVRRFQETNKREIFVPSLFGYAPKAISQLSLWDFEKFFAHAKSRCKEPLVDVMEDLYRFSEDRADEVLWGRGTVTGSFTFYKKRGDERISLFAVYSDGRICVNFGAWKAKGIDEKVRNLVREKLNQIPGIKISSEKIDRYPSFDAKTLTRDTSIKIFKEVILFLVDEITERGNDEEAADAGLNNV